MALIPIRKPRPCLGENNRSIKDMYSATMNAKGIISLERVGKSKDDRHTTKAVILDPDNTLRSLVYKRIHLADLFKKIGLPQDEALNYSFPRLLGPENETGIALTLTTLHSCDFIPSDIEVINRDGVFLISAKPNSIGYCGEVAIIWEGEVTPPTDEACSDATIDAVFHIEGSKDTYWDVVIDGETYNEITFYDMFDLLHDHGVFTHGLQKLFVCTPSSGTFGSLPDPTAGPVPDKPSAYVFFVNSAQLVEDPWSRKVTILGGGVAPENVPEEIENMDIPENTRIFIAYPSEETPLTTEDILEGILDHLSFDTGELGRVDGNYLFTITPPSDDMEIPRMTISGNSGEVSYEYPYVLDATASLTFMRSPEELPVGDEFVYIDASFLFGVGVDEIRVDTCSTFGFANW